ELQRDGFGDELRVQLRAVHFLNVDVHFTLGALLHFLLELVDFRALAADDDAGPRGVNAHDELVGGALDVDGANARALEALFQLAAQLHVFVQQFGVVAVSIPARLPRLVVAEAESVGVRFLSHSRPLFYCGLTGRLTSCPSLERFACRSELCARAARYRAHPFVLPLPLRWRQ